MSGVFTTTGPRGLVYSRRTIFGWLSAGSPGELESKYKAFVDKAEKFAGRPLTPYELVNGIAKPAPSRREVIEARREQANVAYAERIADEAAYDPTQDRLRTAQSLAEEERRAGLSAAQRELEDATRDAEAAKQRREDKQRLAEIKATAAYKSLRESLNDTLLVSKLDATVSQDAVDIIESQIEQLEKTGDVTSVRNNLSEVQKAISGQLEVRDIELQQANDRAAMRKKLLASGTTFDAVDVELVGSLPFVCLTVGDQTKKISQTKYDSRESDESLRAELFGGGESNV